ncbi:MAG: hypothetical protein JNL94_11270 [Planctomycetes bacterium]|nr:hypothetical protein [Planctomycetota bacterium]
MSSSFFPLRRSVPIAAVCIAALAVVGCITQPTAKSYQLAKMNRSGSLVPIDAVIGDRAEASAAPPSSQGGESSGSTATTTTGDEPPKGGDSDRLDTPDRFDQLIETNDCLEIRLADHFVRYLNAVGAPEVVIFTRCRIRSPDSAVPELVYDRILMNTQDQELTQAGLQGAGGSLRDVVVLPAIEYKDEDILLSIRVLELDQDDNKRIGKLLQGASAVSSQLKNASAPELSAFQAVVSFLVANNPDDVEFALDIGLTTNASTTFAREADLLPGMSQTATHVITPRVGMVAAIKTEGVDRFVIPQKYEQYLPQGILWTLANLSRLATLDLFNALPGRVDYDAYSDFFGDPLRVPSNSLIEPGFADGRLVHRTDIDALQSPTARELFVVHDRSLCTLLPGYGGGVPEPFRDKSYVLLSIQSPSLGIPVQELAALSDSLEDLRIRTTQLTPEELAKVLDQIRADYFTRAAKNEARRERDRKKPGDRSKRTDPDQPSTPRKPPGPSDRLREALGPLSIDKPDKDRRILEVESIERD